MIMASRDILAGNMSVGGLVMVQGLLFQLSVPLFFVGSVYREMRQALIDMQVKVEQILIPFVVAGYVPADESCSHNHFSSLCASPQVDSQHSRAVFRQCQVLLLTRTPNPGWSLLHSSCWAEVCHRWRVWEWKIHYCQAALQVLSCFNYLHISVFSRFFKPNSGSINLGGHPIDAVSLDSLRKSISVVPQDSVLFHDTIRHDLFYLINIELCCIFSRHNIGYGDLSAKEEDVIKAAELAELHDSILDWPKGYDTQVGRMCY